MIAMSGFHGWKSAGAVAPLVVIPAWWLLAMGPLPPHWKSAGVAVLGTLLIAASYTDLSAGLVRNWVTVAAAAWAVGLAAAADLGRWWLPGTAWADWLTPLGVPQALAGGLACAILPLLVYAAGAGGGGDVKLALAVGLLLGWKQGLLALAAAYALAGAAGLGWLILSGRLWAQASAGLQSLGRIMAPSASTQRPPRRSVARGTGLSGASERHGGRSLQGAENAEVVVQPSLMTMPMAPFYSAGALLSLLEGIRLP
jgi:Flp pilus assembly protein protease CpaA